MALGIKAPETEGLARDLARTTGESITVVTRRALQERLRRVRRPARKAVLLEELTEIRQRWSTMPVVDDRLPEQIPGYDEDGLP